MAAPTAYMVEVEFTAGVWTDITADVQFQKGVQITSGGRTSEFGNTQPRTMTLELDNHLGKYTPLRQVLADGVTAHPYYPNVQPRKRIRYSYFVGATKYIRYVGFLRSWPPALEGGVLGTVALSASDRFDDLSRAYLKSPIMQEYLNAAPTVFYPLTDPAGSAFGVDASGFGASLAPVRGVAFGSAGPGTSDGTSATLSAGYLQVASGTWGYNIRRSHSVSIFYQRTTALPTASEYLWSASTQSVNGVIGAAMGVDTLGRPVYQYPGIGSVTGAKSICDGAWHSIVVSYTSNLPSTGGLATLYVDGVSVGTLSDVVGAVLPNYQTFMVGFSYADTTSLTGNVGYVAVYPVALTSAQAAASSAAATGYRGDTTDVRISRWLAAAGLTSSDWNLDAGAARMSSYPQAGKDVVSACQDAALTEAGGAAVYIDVDGTVRFVNRNSRTPAAPAITIDAEVDIDGSNYRPAFDELTLLNESTANRSDTTGTLTTQVYTNTAAQTAFGVAMDQGFSTYTTTDGDALATAQWRVANNAYPAFRMQQVAVDLMTAANSLYVSLAGVRIGSRLRVTNLPPNAAPAPQQDVIIEGWTETAATDSYMVVFDTTPADNPARGVWNTSVWGPNMGAMTTSLATASTSTLVVTTSTGPTFTTASGSYPLNVIVGQEVITLNSPPGGSSSPQTFTGVTRGANSTLAAPQPAGSTVNVWPTATYTL